MHKNTNRLIDETSPYLLQHAHNPVDWFPWGEEAFKKAKDENKPIFLSVGYSACHWCHVMEHESFENEEIAAIMNEYFVNIKVDREERPDVDQLYMQFVQMTTGSGGWPMSVFLTPEQKPFFGGTYFPPDDRYGRPGFQRVLQSMYNYYHNEKDKLKESIAQVDNAFTKLTYGGAKNSEIPDRSDWESAVDQLTTFYEPIYGGIGNAPKFPAVQIFDLFLRAYKRTGEQNYLNMVTHTLNNMANGGIYDQLGGGFARYSVDEKWLVPHFEKMLYDNGLLVPLYLDAYLITKDPYYLRVAEETLQFVMRELMSPQGGFYSSLDADSEGEEGKFYVWKRDQIISLLDEKQATIFNAYYDVTAFGNFEGKTILRVVKTVAELAKELTFPIEDIEKSLKESRAILFKERAKRVRPGLDDKIITSWNGLMLSAFARAFQITQNKQYKKVITANINFLKSKLFKNGQLKRTYKNDIAKYDAFIEDYAILSKALLDAYEALFDSDYIEWAVTLNNYSNEHFWDSENGGYFTSSDEQESLIVRLKDDTDNSTPSGTGVMLQNNLRLFSYTENKNYYEVAEKILQSASTSIISNPYGYSSYLNALDLYLEKPLEILIAKDDNHDISAYMDLLFKNYLPNKIVMVLDSADDFSAITASLIQGKESIDGKITAYVCHNFECSLPVFSVNDLQGLINK